MSQDQWGEFGKIVDDPVSATGLSPEVVTLPDGKKTAPLGSDDIHIRVVTDVRRIGGIHTQLRQGSSKDPWIRLPDSGHLRDDNDVEEAANVEPVDLPPLNHRAPVGYQSECQPDLLELPVSRGDSGARRTSLGSEPRNQREAERMPRAAG